MPCQLVLGAFKFFLRLQRFAAILDFHPAGVFAWARLFGIQFSFVAKPLEEQLL